MTTVFDCTDTYCKHNENKRCKLEEITIVGFEHNCIDYEPSENPKKEQKQ